jgi:hypothetical protein
LKKFPIIHLFFLLIIPTTLLLAGCGKQQQIEYIRIKKGPPPEIVAEEGKPKMIPAGFIKRRLRLGLPSAENVVIHDRQYIYITEKWFHDVIKWTEDFIALQVPELNLEQKYPPAYDETFAALASNFANISVAKRYNVQSSVLIGLITAQHEKSWGAIPADGKKRIYIIGLTEKGGIVYDLHTRQSISFDKFPNFDSVSGIMF